MSDLPVGLVAGQSGVVSWLEALNERYNEVNAAGGVSALVGHGGIRLEGAGIDLTGASSSQTRAQALLLQAQSEGKDLIMPPGILLVSQLVTSQSFHQPRIICAGSQKSTIRSSSGLAAVKFKGGSGIENGGGLWDATLDGPGYGVEFAGACGVTVQRCRFKDSLTAGVRFHNDVAGSGGSPGAFTEDCVARDCEFNCRQAIHYLVTAGSESFHGSGFDGQTVFSPPAAGSEPVILVGAGALVYNAPWSGRIWRSSATSPSTVPPIKNLSTRQVVAHGILRYEAPVGSGVVALVDPASTAVVYYAGDVTGYNEGYATGSKFQQVYRATYNIDGTVAAWRKPYQIVTPATTGTTEVTDRLEPGDYTIRVQLNGTNFLYDYLLSVYTSAFADSGSVAVLSQGEAFDAAGWGAPTFAVNGSRKLTVTNNSPGFSVFVTAGITQTLQTKATNAGLLR